MIAISPPAVIERARRSADAERICSPVCTFRLVCGHVEAMAQILSPPPPGDAGALPIQLTGEFPPQGSYHWVMRYLSRFLLGWSSSRAFSL